MWWDVLYFNQDVRNSWIFEWCLIHTMSVVGKSSSTVTFTDFQGSGVADLEVVVFSC